MILNIHNIVSIRLNNESPFIRAFIGDELGYFIDSDPDSDLADIDIFFVKRIDNLEDFIDISDTLKYFKNTICCKYGGGHISIKCFDDNCSKMELYIEESVDSFWVLYVIEKLLMIILPMKGFLIMHASASVRNNMEATMYTGFKASGKTENVLKDVDNGCEFVGDEFIIVDQNANCYCYPRRINIHKFNTNRYWMILSKKILSEILNFRSFKYIEVLVRNIIRGSRYKGYIRLSIFDYLSHTVISNNAKIGKLIICNNRKMSSHVFNSIESSSKLIQYLYNNNMDEYFNRIEKDLLMSIVDKNIKKTPLAKYVKKSMAIHDQILSEFVHSIDNFEVLKKS